MLSGAVTRDGGGASLIFGAAERSATSSAIVTSTGAGIDLQRIGGKPVRRERSEKQHMPRARDAYPDFLRALHVRYPSGLF
jgi:hypothetical protein